MRRFAQAVMLKDDPEVIRKYEYHHSHPWPEVVEGTLRCGVERVFIYRHGRLLFMFMETKDDFDPERDMPKYKEHPKAQEWDKLMRDLQVPLEGTPPGETWVELKEIYALEAK